MSKDVMNELANKLGGQKTQRKSYRDIIIELQSSGFNEYQLQQNLKKTVEVLASEAQSLEGKSKYKDAAIIYYENGIITKELSSTESSNHLDWFEKASNALVSLANEYITWKEVDKAAASLAIANLIHFLKGEWTLLPTYNKFNEDHKELIQQGKTASKSLWVVYDLMTSVTQLNPESLQRAESYAQTALLTQSEPSKTFHDVIQTSLAKAREAMTSQMKLPRIEVSGSLPKDIIFGENFNLDIEIQNSGEGFAHDVTVTIEKIDGLVLTEGQTFSVYYQELEAHSHVQKFSIEFNCPSGEGQRERKFNLKGKVEFLDVLANKRINPIGPYPIIIRAFKKADELKETFSKLQAKYQDIIDKLNNFKSQNESSMAVIDSFNRTINTIVEQTVKFIDDGEFVRVEAQISLFEIFLTSLASSSANLIQEYEETFERIKKHKTKIVDTNAKIRENLTNISKELDDFEASLKKI